MHLFTNQTLLSLEKDTRESEKQVVNNVIYQVKKSVKQPFSYKFMTLKRKILTTERYIQFAFFTYKIFRTNKAYTFYMLFSKIV